MTLKHLSLFPISIKLFTLIQMEKEFGDVPLVSYFPFLGMEEAA